MKKVVIYARFSSENQREESIEAQLRACKDYARSHKYLVVGEYVDRAFTGTNDNRPEFQRMIEDSRKGLFEIALVHKLDRFSRNVEQTIRYISELKDNGVELKSVIEQFDNTPEGEFMRNMMSNISQYYVKNLSREVIKGMKENAYKCLHVGGVPLLGYYVDSDKKYQIDDKEANIVKKIFELYIDGNTHQKIIAELNNLGYKNKRGTEWTKNSLLSIIRNQKYIGTYVWNRVVSKNSKGKRNGHREKPVEEVIRIPNGMPAIISVETFQKAQQIIAKRKLGEESPRRTSTVYLLSSLVKCSCGSGLQGNRRTAKTRPNPNWKPKPTYISYRCTFRKTKDKTLCDNPEIRKEYLEAYVITEIEKLLSTENIQNIWNRYIDYTQKQNSFEISETKTIQNEIDKLDTEIGNLVKAIAMGLDISEISSELVSKKERKAILQNELSQIDSSSNDSISIDDLLEIAGIVRSAIFTEEQLDIKRVLPKVVESITVSREKIDVVFNLFSSFGIFSDELYIRKSILREELYIPFSRRLKMKIERCIKSEVRG